VPAPPRARTRPSGELRELLHRETVRAAGARDPTVQYTLTLTRVSDAVIVEDELAGDREERSPGRVYRYRL
jgi:hypothetical protein